MCTACDQTANLVLVKTSSSGDCAESKVGACVCMKGFFLEKIEDCEGDIHFECMPCHKTCKECVGPDKEDCTVCEKASSHLKEAGAKRSSCVCNKGFFRSLVTLKCEKQCGDKTKGNGPTTCDVSCAKNCAECSGTSMMDCTKCSANHVPIPWREAFP